MVFFLCNTRCPLFALFRPRACPWYAANQLQRKRINNNNSFGTDGSNSRSIRGSSRLLVGNIVPSVGLWFFLRSPTLFWRESWWEKGVFFSCLAIVVIALMIDPSLGTNHHQLLVPSIKEQAISMQQQQQYQQKQPTRPLMNDELSRKENDNPPCIGSGLSPEAAIM